MIIISILNAKKKAWNWKLFNSKFFDWVKFSFEWTNFEIITTDITIEKDYQATF